MQRGVVQQVLQHREIEVEGARLEHDPEQPQRFAGRTRDIVAEDADVPGLDAEQPGDQREQRALAGAVQSQKRREAPPGAEPEKSMSMQALRVAPAIGSMADARRSTAPALVRLRPRLVDSNRRTRAGHAARPIAVMVAGAMVTPQGNSPTWMVLIEPFAPPRRSPRRPLETPLVTSRVLLIRGECHVPDPLADQQVFCHLMAGGIDHRDPVGRSERDEGVLCSSLVMPPEIRRPAWIRLAQPQAGNLEG